jgi:hypothetical protein
MLFIKIDDYLERTKDYSVSEKIALLKEKKSRYLKNKKPEE